MVEQFKYRDKLREMAGGREAVLAKAAEMLGSTHAITKAADASKIERKKVQKHVVETILAGAMGLIRPALVAALDAHIEAVEDEYALLEGDSPDGDGVDEWWAALFEKQFESLQGDILSALGGDEAMLRNFVNADASADEFVNYILERPVSDPAGALAALGITTTDIEALVNRVLANDFEPQKTAQRRVRVAEIDAYEAFSDRRESTPESPADIPPPAALPRRRAPSVEEPNDLTRAAQAALVALYEIAGAKEGDIAAMLGVSRPQANNYRHGKTLFAPSEAQVGEIARLLGEASEKLLAAKTELEMAALG